jgi:GDP-4-dehydro-6-deoxy-D-mannose reductase
MKKALITGITGFAGSYLAHELLNNGYDVCGSFLNENSISLLPDREKFRLYKLDLLDETKTNELIDKEKPDYLFHLAGLTSPRKSIANPKEVIINNTVAQINLFEAIKKLNLKNIKILIVSSAEVYGLVNKTDLPMSENTPLNPTNPYAVSKLTQDYLGLQYFLSDKLNIVRVRPFNHIGPRQAPDFVVPTFAKRIVEIERGNSNVMKVGILSSKRDFTDVVDMVKAYKLALEKGVSGEVYNLGFGKSYSIKEILDIMIGLSKVEIKVEEDPALVKQSDDPELLCDYTKFKNLTGWSPQIPIEKTLENTLDYWRKQD